MSPGRRVMMIVMIIIPVVFIILGLILLSHAHSSSGSLASGYSRVIIPVVSVLTAGVLRKRRQP